MRERRPSFCIASRGSTELVPVPSEPKVECPNCSQPMTRAASSRQREEANVHTFECKPCGVGITQTVQDKPEER
jgi:hypothetical protein